jgi:hypothetical protein
MAAAFTSEECDLLQQALDTAWEIVQAKGRPKPSDAEAFKAALTRAILDEYEHGEHNVRRMAIAAVAHVEQFQARREPKPAL